MEPWCKQKHLLRLSLKSPGVFLRDNISLEEESWLAQETEHQLTLHTVLVEA